MPSQSTSCSKEKKQPVLNCNKLKFVIQETFVSYRWKFYNIYISQGSVATPLRCDGICFITCLLPSPRVKKFWKSANGCRSYEQLSNCSVGFPAKHGVQPFNMARAFSNAEKLWLELAASFSTTEHTAADIVERHLHTHVERNWWQWQRSLTHTHARTRKHTLYDKKQLEAGVRSQTNGPT